MPNKTYLINVINTLDQDLILRTIMELKKKRESQELNEDPLMILPEFMEQLNQFNSITNSNKVVSVRRLVSIEYNECCICRQ